jgi:hypothetical protein
MCYYTPYVSRACATGHPTLAVHDESITHFADCGQHCELMGTFHALRLADSVYMARCDADFLGEELRILTVLSTSLRNWTLAQNCPKKHWEIMDHAITWRVLSLSTHRGTIRGRGGTGTPLCMSSGAATKVPSPRLCVGMFPSPVPTLWWCSGPCCSEVWRGLRDVILQCVGVPNVLTTTQNVTAGG